MQIVEGLKYLQSLNMMHRDLKAANILIDRNGYIKISDFGLASIVSVSRQIKDIVGTPEYQAPEILKNRGYDKKVDWWAVGIIIYEMLFGVTPFFNRHIHKILNSILEEDVRFPNRRRIPHTEAAQDLISKLLDKNP